MPRARCPSKAGSFLGKHFIVISGANFILKREGDNGVTVPHVINDLINGEWFFFFLFGGGGTEKKKVIVRMSVFSFFIVILDVGDGCFF